MNLLSHMAPRALCLLSLLLLLLERDAPTVAWRAARDQPRFGLLLLLNCLAAVCMNLSNFLVTKHTSALTLQVLGKAKSVFAVLLSLILFRNPVSMLGIAGYLVCLWGVGRYSQERRADLAAAASAAPKAIEAGAAAAAPEDVEGGPAEDWAAKQEKLG